MTEIATQLQASRAAAARARQAWKARKFDEARVFFAEALKTRRQATKLDPEFADDAWSDDLLSTLTIPGQGRATMRHKGLSSVELIKRQNSDLIDYYKLQLGLTSNPTQTTDARPEKSVIVPDRWDVVTPGRLLDVACKHVWEILKGRRKGQRQCIACDQVEALAPRMPIEESEAYKQLKREQGRKH